MLSAAKTLGKGIALFALGVALVPCVFGTWLILVVACR